MNIFVGSLPFSIEEADLRESFEAYGAVDSVKIITDKFTGRSKGFGFVEMPSDDEAQKAIDELNGATYTLSIKYQKLLLEARSGYGERIPVLKWANGREAPKDTLLTPAFADAFFTSGERAILRFRRNQQNAIYGFTLTVGNSVRRLSFNKQ